MASISYTLSSSHPPALLALRALCAAAGLSAVTFSPTPLTSTASTGPASFGNSSSVKFQLGVETTDAFGSTSSSTVHGLTAVVRALSAVHPTLKLYGSTESDATAVEGWLESLSGVIEAAYAVGDAPASAKDVKDAVESFGRTVESALSASAGTKYLTGDTITAADIVVAVVLTAAATRVKADPLGAKADGLVHAVCGAPVVKSAIDEGAGSITASELKVVEGAVPQLAAEMDKLSMGGGGTSPSNEGPTSEELAANPIVLQLAQLGLPTDTTYGHALCVTAEDLVSSVPLPSSTHTHTKNLLFKDKKHGLYLVSTTPTAEVNTKALGKDLLHLEGKVNLRLASEDVLLEKLKCAKGCVGPLAMVNNSDRDITLVLDENLMKKEAIHSHPMRNDASTVLTPAELTDYLGKIGVEPVVVDFPQKDADGGADSAESAEKWEGKPPASRPPASKEESGGGKKAKPKIPKKDKKKDGQQPKVKDTTNKKQVKKGETLLALQWKKAENFPMWYSDVIVLSEMISYYDISGCYILRPWSYKMWELIQVSLTAELRSGGVGNGTLGVEFWGCRRVRCGHVSLRTNAWHCWLILFLVERYRYRGNGIICTLFSYMLFRRLGVVRVIEFFNISASTPSTYLVSTFGVLTHSCHDSFVLSISLFFFNLLFRNGSTSKSASSTWRTRTFPSSCRRIVSKRRRTTSRDSLPRWPG